jgi:imidazole glycerol-phosphate synthase subunit HisH
MKHRKIVGVIDYRCGNIRSVMNAIAAVGAECKLVSTSQDLEDCSHALLPGVGAFGFCADRLRESGMLPALERWVRQERRPLLGICVGMQLMADIGEEQGRHAGLSWIGGTVRKLRRLADSGVRVPHVGWNEARFVQPFGSFKAGDAADFYFDHSFGYQDAPPGSEIARCKHGDEFVALVRKDNIVAAQFHPEKSQVAGMRFLESFLSI